MRDDWERGGPPRGRGPHSHDRGGTQRGGPQRGVPDGLLVGFLAFLLGATVLVWTATNLAGRFAHGSWPENVSFGHTPPAVRHLAGQPHDLAGAWPRTPPDQLSGYGLFWGLFIGQLMILIVLTVFVMGTVARWRAVRRVRREAAAAAGAGAVAGAGASGDMYRPRAGGTENTPVPAQEPRAGGTEPTEVPARPVRAGGAENTEVPAQATHAGGMESQVERVGGWENRAGGAENGAPSPARPAGGPRAGGAENSTPFPSPPPGGPLLLGSPATRRPHAVEAIRDAEGAALVLTSDPTLWAETKDARAKLGPVLLYDPAHLCDTPARLHWSPTAGCRDKETADQRAVALLAPIRPAAKLDAAVADTARILMRSFLHAAAVGDKPMKAVHRWSQGTQVQEAVRILRTHPKASSGAAGELEAALTAYPERRDIAQELTARALSALFTVHVRESCTPNRTDALTLDSFVHEGGTLFVVGEAIEDPKSHQGPGAMPLLTALASSVVEHGRRMAERSSSGRLDPPMTLVLDDVAAVAPLPQLPELLAEGAKRGLPTLALLRSREQGRARWPDAELPTG
ncbi:type IV secretory system conjugative DNA transfer family protein [Streptomyces sp. NPDC058284]|uniref:type IV secretory system conjugative DNA transfer family protein n=1 Tax=unclassified Streptomyces TaxID=2593676 RepID=UPI003652BB13